MFRAEDSQRDGDTETAQGNDLVRAARLRDFLSRGPGSDQEKGDTGGAGGEHDGRGFGERSENHWRDRLLSG